MQGDRGELDSRGRLKFCTLLEFHLRDIVISLVSYIYDSFKMVFDCLLVVVDVFEVVVGRSFF